MFGYVTITPEGISNELRERYRMFYCGLCHTLGEHYGAFGRMTLSYDMTFLAILLSSLYEPEERTEKARCAPHPIKEHGYIRSEVMDYCADMNIALAYHKCLDDWTDERKPAARIEAKALERAYKQIRGRYPEKCGMIERCLGEISALEKQGSANIDELANLTGTMLGAIYRYREDEWADTLERVGEGLGRFIYLMDAYEDLPSDKRKRCFNPLLRASESDGYEVLIKNALTLLIADGTEAFEELPLVRDMDILRNILYAGCWLRYGQLQAKRERAEGKLKPKEDGA